MPGLSGHQIFHSIAVRNTKSLRQGIAESLRKKTTAYIRYRKRNKNQASLFFVGKKQKNFSSLYPEIVRVRWLFDIGSKRHR